MKLKNIGFGESVWRPVAAVLRRCGGSVVGLGLRRCWSLVSRLLLLPGGSEPLGPGIATCCAGAAFHGKLLSASLVLVPSRCKRVLLPSLRVRSRPLIRRSAAVRLSSREPVQLLFLG